MPRITGGVDAGKGSHQAAGDDPARDRVVGRITFPVSWDGFERLRAFPEGLAAELGDVLVGPEATGHYHLTLVELLAEQGYEVVLINPHQAAQFRRSQGGKAKTDRIDARALARFVAVGNAAATPQPDATPAGLRELTRFRAELVGDRTVAINRLHGALDLAFPDLPALLGRLNTSTTLALLASYPTAASVAETDPDAVLALVHRAGCGLLGSGRVDALSRRSSALGFSWTPDWGMMPRGGRAHERGACAERRAWSVVVAAEDGGRAAGAARRGSRCAESGAWGDGRDDRAVA